MLSETQNDWGSCHRSAETEVQLGSSSVDFRDSSQRIYRLHRRSQSFNGGNALRNPHGIVGPTGNGYTERCTDADVSPPPRLPLAFSLGGSSLHIGQQYGYAARFYGESDGDGDEDADGGGDDEEWEDEEEYDESNEDEEDDSDDSGVGNCGSAVNDTTASGVFSQGVRALYFDFDESSAAPSTDAQIAGGLGFRTPQQAPLYALGQGSIDATCSAAAAAASTAKAAPGTTGSFRRATPVARAAYSVGYDRAAGESSEDPASASSPRGEDPVASTAGSFERTSLTLTTNNTHGDATQGGPEMTMVARLLSGSTCGPTPQPSDAACHTPAALVACCEASSRAAAHRRSGSSSAGSCVECASEFLQGYERTKRNTKESRQRTPDQRHASTTSSPLSPQRPTIEARDEAHAHICSDNAFPTGFGNTVAPLVLALDEGDNARKSGDEPSGNDAEGPALPSPTEPPGEPVTVSVVPVKTMDDAVVAPDKPSPLLAADRSSSVEDLLERCKDSTVAADIGVSACEREGHVQSSPSMAVSPVSGVSPPAVTPISTGQSPLEELPSGEVANVDETSNDSAAAENREVPYMPAESGAPAVHAPAATLRVSVTNVFNYSEAEWMWLSCDQLSACPARAMRAPTCMTGSKVPPATSGALGKALPPLSAPDGTVSLYCRPFLVQLPCPSPRTPALCTAGNSTFVKVTLILLYYVPFILVPTVLRVLVYFVVALYFLAAGLATMDAAWSRWVIGSVYAAELHDSATRILLSVLE